MVVVQSFSRGSLARLALAGAAACWAISSMSSPAAAQERFAGQWTVSRAVAAPWASEPKDQSDAAEAQRLLGKQLSIGAHFFRAPSRSDAPDRLMFFATPQPILCSKAA
jgi:hypothetical protein